MDNGDDLNLKKDIDDYNVKTATTSVFIGTWNLHARDPPSDLTDFIPPNRYDIYAIGTEECGQSLEVSIVYDNKSKWEKQLIDHIGPEWHPIERSTLNAIHLIVFVRRTLLPYISSNCSSTVATGIGNIIGNKGGVGISFYLGHTSVAFVNCHFHAHDSSIEQRNLDFHMINNSLSLLNVKSQQSISDFFDIVFWFGDLNYRINGGRRMVDDLIRRQMVEVMKANEQLAIEMRKGTVFSGFEEAEITFPPTYKFDKNSDVYDSSPKQRVPSWTDRILWKRSPNIRSVSYSSIDTMRTSDHRPVVAIFQAECHVDDQIRPHEKGDNCTIQ